jgi:hypothetical protein
MNRKVTISKLSHGDYSYCGRTYRYDSAYKRLYVFDENANGYIYCCGNPQNVSPKKLIKSFADDNN